MVQMNLSPSLPMEFFQNLCVSGVGWGVGGVQASTVSKGVVLCAQSSATASDHFSGEDFTENIMPLWTSVEDIFPFY